MAHGERLATEEKSFNEVTRTPHTLCNRHTRATLRWSFSRASRSCMTLECEFPRVQFCEKEEENAPLEEDFAPEKAEMLPVGVGG